MNEESSNIHTVPYVYNSTTIVPFDDLKRELASDYLEMEISFNIPQMAEYPGRNISAFLPGKGRTKEDPGHVIVIGTGYDGVYHNGDKAFVNDISSTAINLELARMFAQMDEPFEKSILFIFWDNENQGYKSGDLNGSAYYNREEQETIRMALNHGYYYIDLNKAGLEENDQVEFMVLAAQRLDGNSYLIGLDMEKRFKQLDIDYKRFHYWDYASNALWELRLNAVTTIGLGSPYPNLANSAMDNMDNLNLEKVKNMGQIILDIFTMNPRIME